jgi:anti-anti-sigma regulatory factor
VGDRSERRPPARGAGRPDRPRLAVIQAPSGVRVIRVGAVFDAAAAAELRREISALLARSMSPLVLDLSVVCAVEEDAVSAVLRHVVHEAGDADVDLRVVRRPSVDEVTRAVSRQGSLLEVFPTLEAALGDPRRPGR